MLKVIKIYYYVPGFSKSILKDWRNILNNGNK